MVYYFEYLDCGPAWDGIKGLTDHLHRLTVDNLYASERRTAIYAPAAAFRKDLLPEEPCWIGNLTTFVWAMIEQGGEWSIRDPPDFVTEIAALDAATMMDIALSGWPLFSLLSIWADAVFGDSNPERPAKIEDVWTHNIEDTSEDMWNDRVWRRLVEAYLGEASLFDAISVLEFVRTSTNLEDFAGAAGFYRLWEVLDSMRLSHPWVHIHDPQIMMRVFPYRDMMSDRIRAFRALHCPSSVTDEIDKLPNDAHFVEVGSSLGDCTLYFLAKRSAGTAVAFEIVPTIVDAFQATLRENNFAHRCIVVKKAIGEISMKKLLITYNRGGFYNMAGTTQDADSEGYS